MRFVCSLLLRTLSADFHLYLTISEMDDGAVYLQERLNEYWVFHNDSSW